MVLPQEAFTRSSLTLVWIVDLLCSFSKYRPSLIPYCATLWVLEWLEVFTRHRVRQACSSFCHPFLFYCAGCLDRSRWAWDHVKTLWFSKFHLSFRRVAYIHGFRTVVVLDCCTNKGQIPAEYLAGINPLEDIGKPRWQWSHSKSLVVGWNWVEINLIWKLGHSIDTQTWNVSSLWQWRGGMLKVAVGGSHSGFCPVYGITSDTGKTIKNQIISERRDRILGGRITCHQRTDWFRGSNFLDLLVLPECSCK